jgi:hypothetical protein
MINKMHPKSFTDGGVGIADNTFFMGCLLINVLVNAWMI